MYEKRTHSKYVVFYAVFSGSFTILAFLWVALNIHLTMDKRLEKMFRFMPNKILHKIGNAGKKKYKKPFAPRPDLT